jgi:hypothetical protein
MLMLYLIMVACLLVLIGAAVGIRRSIVNHGQKSAAAERKENITIQH